MFLNNNSLDYFIIILNLFLSTFLDPETRRAMGEQAVALAKRIGYSSAGYVTRYYWYEEL